MKPELTSQTLPDENAAELLVGPDTQGIFACSSVLGFLAFLLAAKSLPLGPVVALRETSVIFGAVIGTLLLKEGFGLRRIVAAALVVGGIALLAFLR